MDYLTFEVQPGLKWLIGEPLPPSRTETTQAVVNFLVVFLFFYVFHIRPACEFCFCYALWPHLLVFWAGHVWQKWKIFDWPFFFLFKWHYSVRIGCSTLFYTVLFLDAHQPHPRAHTASVLMLTCALIPASSNTSACWCEKHKSITLNLLC